MFVLRLQRRLSIANNQSAKVANNLFGAMKTETLLAPVIGALKEHYPKAELTSIEKAFAVAHNAHSGQLRKSGEDYITHPVAVTQILAELGLNETAILSDD